MNVPQGMFLFTDKPDWKNLDKLDPVLGFKAYEHQDGKLWILESVEGEFDEEQENPLEVLAIDREDLFPNDEVTLALRAMFRILDEQTHRSLYGPSWARLISTVASTLSVPTYFFAEDGWWKSMGFHADANGVIQNLSILNEPYLLNYSGGNWSIVPRTVSYKQYDGQDESIPEITEVVLGELSKLSNVRVLDQIRASNPSITINSEGSEFNEWWPDSQHPGWIIKDFESEFSKVYEKTPVENDCEEEVYSFDNPDGTIVKYALKDFVGVDSKSYGILQKYSTDEPVVAMKMVDCDDDMVFKNIEDPALYDRVMEKYKSSVEGEEKGLTETAKNDVSKKEKEEPKGKKPWWKVFG